MYTLIGKQQLDRLPFCYRMYENEDHGLGGKRDVMWANYEAFFMGVYNVCLCI